MKMIPRDWRDVRNASLDTGGRSDLPRPIPRARGGKIEMRSAGGTDVDRDQLRRPKRRATGGRSGAKSVVMSGPHPKHRADRAPRGKKRASGGSSSSSSSGLSFGALPGGIPWLPSIAITPGRGAPNPPPVSQDQGAQQMAAFANAIGKTNSGGGSGQSNKPQDLGYAVYSDGTPIGIRGIAPFADAAQDISASKRGGRVRGKHARNNQQRSVRS
jgi:hypothetical protein